MNFQVFFNKKKQWVNVYLWDVHPTTFSNWNSGRWGYFVAEWESPSLGHFGSLHFVKSRLRIDTISHEIDHLRAEWIWANRTAFIARNEERLIETKDRILWRLLKELAKIEPATRCWSKTLDELKLSRKSKVSR